MTLSVQQTPVIPFCLTTAACKEKYDAAMVTNKYPSITMAMHASSQMLWAWLTSAALLVNPRISLCWNTSLRDELLNASQTPGAVIVRSSPTVLWEGLPWWFEFLDGVFKGLALVAEPDSNYFSVVVQLVWQLSHFSSCKETEVAIRERGGVQDWSTVLADNIKVNQLQNTDIYDVSFHLTPTQLTLWLWYSAVIGGKLCLDFPLNSY